MNIVKSIIIFFQCTNNYLLMFSVWSLSVINQSSEGSNYCDFVQKIIFDLFSIKSYFDICNSSWRKACKLKSCTRTSLAPLISLNALNSFNSARLGEHWLSHPLTCEGHASIKGLLPPLYSGCTYSVSAVSHALGRDTVYCQEFSCVLFRSPFMATESLP